MSEQSPVAAAFDLAYQAGPEQVIALREKLFAANDFSLLEYSSEVFTQLEKVTKRFMDDDKLDEALEQLRFLYRKNSASRGEESDQGMHPIFSLGVNLANKYLAQNNAHKACDAAMFQYESIPFGKPGRETARKFLERRRKAYITSGDGESALKLAKEITVEGAHESEEIKESWNYLTQIRNDHFKAGETNKANGINVFLVGTCAKNSQEKQEAYEYTATLKKQFIAEENPKSAASMIFYEENYRRDHSSGGLKEVYTIDRCNDVVSIARLYMKQDRYEEAINLLAKTLMKTYRTGPEGKLLLTELKKIRDDFIKADKLQNAEALIFWEANIKENGEYNGIWQVGPEESYTYQSKDEDWTESIGKFIEIGEIYLARGDLDNAARLGCIVDKHAKKSGQNFLDRLQEACIASNQPEKCRVLMSPANGLRIAALYVEKGDFQQATSCAADQHMHSIDGSADQIAAGKYLHDALDDHLKNERVDEAEYTLIYAQCCVHAFYSQNSRMFKDDPCEHGLSSDILDEKSKEVVALRLKKTGADETFKHARTISEYSNSTWSFKARALASEMLLQTLGAYKEQKDPVKMKRLIDWCKNEKNDRYIDVDNVLAQRIEIAKIHLEIGKPEQALLHAQHFYTHTIGWTSSKDGTWKSDADGCWDFVTQMRNYYAEQKDQKKVEEIAEWQKEESRFNDIHKQEIQAYFDAIAAKEAEKNNFDNVLAGFVNNLQPPPANDDGAAEKLVVN